MYAKLSHLCRSGCNIFEQKKNYSLTSPLMHISNNSIQYGCAYIDGFDWKQCYLRRNLQVITNQRPAEECGSQIKGRWLSLFYIKDWQHLMWILLLRTHYCNLHFITFRGLDFVLDNVRNSFHRDGQGSRNCRLLQGSSPCTVICLRW